jgi:DNA mismatch repair protein MutL
MTAAKMEHQTATDRGGPAPVSAPRIRVLDRHIANKIAAGEVVERPASVAKELIENALDAQPSRVEVHVEAGGTRLVRVVDDGWGIEAEDLKAAFLPHATSKLGDVEDLESIATLGFRGEALASIGSVSDASILSRVRGAESGHRIDNRGGEIVGPRAAGTAPGTEVIVRNLFFNTPARAKFLRTVRTEMGHVEELVRRFALAFPEVGFRLQHDANEVFRCEPGEDRRLRLERLYGRELAADLLAVSATNDRVRLEGFVAPPSRTRPHAREMRFFVNGRFVRDKVLHRVVRELVDVNVHPTKAEVRWRDSRVLHGLVAPAIARTLRSADLAADLDGAVELAADPNALPDHAAAVQRAMSDFLGRARDDRGQGFVQAPASPRYGYPAPARPEPRVIQMHDSWLVCEVEDGIAIVDQHALHERVNYDRILAKLMEGGVEGQRLLVAEQIDLAPGDSGLLEEQADLLRCCGFEWSPFGGDAVALEAIPAVIPRARAGELLRDLIELLRVRGDRIDAKLLFHDVADTMACKASVRFGDRLSREEAVALLEESGALESSFVCPHGRPTVLRITQAELEKRFGRR